MPRKRSLNPSQEAVLRDWIESRQQTVARFAAHWRCTRQTVYATIRRLKTEDQRASLDRSSS